MAQKKQFKDLDLCNAFLFSAALEDEEICRLVIKMILGHSIEKLRVKAERSILFSSDIRSVRLDIYAADEAEIAYNLEMQNKNEHNLGRRCRYHQAEMDLSSLKPGQDFNGLQPSYIIFICTFDPFGEGIYRYTFEKKCRERNIILNDGTCTIILNTKGKNDNEVEPELVHFLRYVEESNEKTVMETGDQVIANLHNKIMELKKSRELEARYMWFEEFLQSELKEAKEEAMAEGREEGRAEGRAEGREEGRAEGSERMLKLVKKMLQDGQVGQIECLEEDLLFREEMYNKYHV